MTLRRIVSIAAVVAVVLALAVPAPAAKAPKCRGERATIWGTAGADQLIGTSGRDVIAGLGGNDTIFGLGGNDLLCGDAGDDFIDGGSGSDSVNGGTGDDVLFGRGGRDSLYGGTGDDAMDGGRSADWLWGNAGRDLLLGRDHKDHLRGGYGDDVLAGGRGRDPGVGGRGSDLCSGLTSARTCESVDPGLWDWVRTSQASQLSDRLRALVVLQTGCLSPLDIERAAMAAEAFPDPGHEHLTAAVADLRQSALACNVDPDAWRMSLRDALVHIEGFTALMAGGAPQAVGPLATAAEAAPAAIDVIQTLDGYLVGGNPPWPESDFWWELRHEGNARQLEVAAAGGGYDVLFVGSSIVWSAADPALFTDLDGRTSYNTAMPRSGPEVQASWLKDYAVDLATPDVVVIGVEDRAFRPFSDIPGSCVEANDSWFAARDLRQAAFAPVDALAGLDEGDLFFGVPPSPDPTRPLEVHDRFTNNAGLLGERLHYGRILTDQEKQVQLRSITNWSIGYEPCEDRMDIIAALAADLEGAGIDVVLVAMPASDIRAGAFDPTGENDVAAGRAVLSDLVERLATLAAGAGADFIDLSDHPAVGEEHFMDIHHLGREGRTIFTTLLVAALAAL